MAKLFIGIALAVMLATAALGFLAKGNIDKLQSTRKEQKVQIEKAESDKRKAEGETKKTQEELTAANAKVEETTKALDDQKKATEDEKKNAADAKALVTAKETEIGELKIAIDKLRGTTPPGTTEDPQIGLLQGQLKKAQADLAEATVLKDSLANRVKDTEAKASAAEQKIKAMQAGAVRAGLQGRILAVNAGWNFVVLSVGDKQGVAVNAPLLVVRGNEPIARLRITSVEPSTSIADVIPGSVRRGASVQPGDTVIFEGRSAATQVPKIPAAGADAAPAPALPN